MKEKSFFTNKRLTITAVVTGVIACTGLILSWVAGHADWSTEGSTWRWESAYLLVIVLPFGLITALLAAIVHKRKKQ